jgi:hypothetical protein
MSTVFTMDVDSFEMIDASDPVKTEPSKHTEYVKKLQVAILLDITGSMGPFFAATKSALTTLLMQMPSDKELEVALTRFNDYNVDSNKVYVPREASCCISTDFTSAANIISILDCLSAGGGGDAPEALSLALRFVADTTKISWDPSPCVSKTIVLATDAPPHGLGYASGDSFPLGDPDTGPNGCGPQLRDPNGELMHLDPLAYVNALKNLNVAVHTVKIGESVDPKFDIFMKLVAAVTGGKAMAFDEVCSLGDVIAGISLEDAACAELAGAIASELEKLMLDGIDKDAATEAAIAKVASTVDSEEFVSVNAREIPLDDKSAVIFRSLSNETTLPIFRTATKTLTTSGYEDTTLSGTKRYRSLGGGFCDEGYVPHYHSLSDIPTYPSLSAAAEEAPWVPSYAAISNHLSEMDPVDEDAPTHPVYRSSAMLAHSSAVDSHAASVFRSLSGPAAPTPPSTPSPRLSKAATSASVKKGLTPALLARAAARVASSA